MSNHTTDASLNPPSHVLLRSKAHSGVYHRPDPENPDRPDCEVDDRCPEATFWRVDRSRAPDSYRECRYCDPDVENTRHQGGASGPHETLRDPEFSPGDLGLEEWPA